MGKKSRDLPTILNDLYGEIFGNIGDKEETSGVVKLKRVVVNSVGNYGKVGYWVKDLIIHYGWFDSTEEKGWTYCDTRNEAKRVKAKNRRKIKKQQNKEFIKMVYAEWGIKEKKYKSKPMKFNRKQKTFFWGEHYKLEEN